MFARSDAEVKSIFVAEVVRLLTDDGHRRRSWTIRTPRLRFLKLRCFEMQSFHAQNCARRAALRKHAVVAAEGSHGTLTLCRSPDFRE